MQYTPNGIINPTVLKTQTIKTHPTADYLIAIVEGKYIIKLDDKTSALKDYKTAFKLPTTITVQYDAEGKPIGKNTLAPSQEPSAFIKRNKLVEQYLQRKGLPFISIYKRNIIALYNDKSPLSCDGINPMWLGQNQIVHFLSTIGVQLDPNIYISLQDLRELVIEYQRSPFDKTQFHQLLDKRVSVRKASEDLIDSTMISKDEEETLLNQFDGLAGTSGIQTTNNDSNPVKNASPTHQKKGSKGKTSVKQEQEPSIIPNDDEIDSILG